MVLCGSDGMDKYEIIKGYHARNDETEGKTMRYMRSSDVEQ